MADNTTLDAGSGGDTMATDEVSYSGDTAKIQLTRFVHVSGSEGAKTVSELVKAEDAAHASGDFGLPMLGVRQDTAASLAGTDGDYTMPIFDSTGRMHVNVGSTVSTAANQTTIISHLDGVEGLLTTIDADTGTMVTHLSEIEGAVETVEASVATIGTTPLVRVAIFDAADAQITSFGGGVQYTEGDTDATITGTAILWEDTGNVLTAVSGSNQLPVKVYGGSTAVDFPVSSNPVIIGSSASAAAPTSVSADGDAVRAWYLRGGARPHPRGGSQRRRRHQRARRGRDASHGHRDHRWCRHQCGHVRGAGKRRCPDRASDHGRLGQLRQ
jgi:hypothetical protein